MLLGIRKANFECFLIPEYVIFFLYSRNTSLVFTIEKLEKQVQARIRISQKKKIGGGTFRSIFSDFHKTKIMAVQCVFFKHKYI